MLRRWRGSARRQVIPAAALALLVAGTSAALLPQGSRFKSPPARPRVASLVALPTEVLGSPTDSHLAELVPSTLSNHLTDVAGVETRAPATRLEFERLRGDLGGLAESYQVSTVVRSSLTVAGDRCLLTVQLVDADTRNLLWSRQLEGPPGSCLTLARRAAESLREWLQPA